jgi:hypothetical protein
LQLIVSAVENRLTKWIAGAARQGIARDLLMPIFAARRALYPGRIRFGGHTLIMLTALGCRSRSIYRLRSNTPNRPAFRTPHTPALGRHWGLDIILSGASRAFDDH